MTIRLNFSTANRSDSEVVNMSLSLGDREFDTLLSAGHHARTSLMTGLGQ